MVTIKLKSEVWEGEYKDPQINGPYRFTERNGLY